MTPRKTTSDAEAAKKSKVKSDLEVEIEDVSLDKLGVHMLFGEVDDDSARELCEFVVKSNFMFQKTKTLTIMINSPGGDVYAGFSMVDLMQTSRLKIQTVAVGFIASMGSVIFTAGTPGLRIMSKNSYMMTHQFTSMLEAKYHELVATRSHEDDLHRRIIEHYVKYSKMTEKQVRDVILGPSDKWITPTEALRYGLCDKVQNPWT